MGLVLHMNAVIVFKMLQALAKRKTIYILIVIHSIGYCSLLLMIYCSLALFVKYSLLESLTSIIIRPKGWRKQQKRAESSRSSSSMKLNVWRQATCALYRQQTPWSTSRLLWYMVSVSDRDEVKRGGTQMLPGFMISRMRMVSKNSPFLLPRSSKSQMVQ